MNSTVTNKSCIVDMIEEKSIFPKNSRKSKGYFPSKVPPFKVAYTLAYGDEVHPKPTDVLSVMTHDMFYDAADYKDDGAFVDLIESVCKSRVVLCIGLGGAIYFESKEDALAILNFYTTEEK
jgi:hypothetical protein